MHCMQLVGALSQHCVVVAGCRYDSSGCNTRLGMLFWQEKALRLVWVLEYISIAKDGCLPGAHPIFMSAHLSHRP